MAVALLLILPAEALPEETSLLGCFTNLDKIAHQNELYISKNLNYALSLRSLECSDLRCPSSGCEYKYESSGEDYLVYCQGHAHGKDGARLDHPKWTKSGFELK